MSYKASYWLQNLDPKLTNASAFRVLFFLCAYHHQDKDPRSACFPSQETLREGTGLSNGAVNNALNALEDARLILRRRSTVPGGTARRTYYMLGCDYDLTATQNPESGDSANSGDVEPARLQTPFSGQANSTFKESKLHPGGEEYNNKGKGKREIGISDNLFSMHVKWWRSNKTQPVGMSNPKLVGERFIAEGIATRTELADAYWEGISRKAPKSSKQGASQ